MGDFSQLDRWIVAQEKAERKSIEEQEATLEEYFDWRERKRLEKMNIDNMSWDDVDSLNNIRKSADDKYKDPTVSNPDPSEQKVEVLDMLSQCVEVASQNGRQDLIPLFKKVAQLMSQQDKLNPRNPIEENNATEADFDSGVQKCQRKVVSAIIHECTRANDIKNH